MLATNQQGNSYLVSTRPHRLWTAEEERVLFTKLDADEKKLYILILSYLPLGSLHTSKLKSSLEHVKEMTPTFARSLKLIQSYFDAFNEEGHLTKVQARSLKRFIDEMTNEFRMLEGPRDWVKSLMKDITNPDLIETDEYEPFVGALSTSQYRTWVKKVQEKYAAILKTKNQFMEDNTGLVARIVMKRTRMGVVNTPFIDLLQEGHFGLIKAINKFDYRRGLKFSTYSSWWIRHSISRAIYDKDRLIRIPVHINDKAFRIQTANHDYKVKHGEAPSVEYLAKAAGTSHKVVKEILESIKVFSLDVQVSGGEDDGDGYGITPDTKIKSAFDGVCEQEASKVLHEALKDLSPRELTIIRGRFGIGVEQDTDEVSTLKEIGDTFDLSRERVRQLESDALKKLRSFMSKRKIHTRHDVAAN